ncbi:MAG: RluA family pseudouridine synthase [Alphaproteobacteria bacterium CG_4_10_14_0_8_um_filter_53_9]|nr:MAG: RluA family pseudouridine synthase [Alphaproteobacteria bacterium CG_4_10_14_0_8_um_filter_53_9]
MENHPIPASEEGQRLDRYLKKLVPETPFVALQKLIRKGQVRVDGKRALPNTKLQAGQILRLPPNLSQTTPASAPAPAKQFTLSTEEKATLQNAVVYQDAYILVLNKPAGLAAQAGNGITKSLDRWLAALYPKTPPKLTHRLDRETSGLIVLAFTREAAANLTAQFADHKVEKIYQALLTGILNAQEEGAAATHHIRAPLAKQGSKSIIPHSSYGPTTEQPKQAHTSYQIQSHPHLAGHTFTRVNATPHTGRMNQLRAHFAHIGHPIVGDTKYGNEQSKQAAKALHPTGKLPLYLHAAHLSFTHPQTAEKLTFTAPIPPQWHASLQS